MRQARSGDELRTIGGEGTLEWRREEGTLPLIGALLRWNDPAGVMIADRGWTSKIVRPRCSMIFARRMRPPFFSPACHRTRRQSSTRSITARAGTQERTGPIGLRGACTCFATTTKRIPLPHNGNDFAWRTDFWDAGLTPRLESRAPVCRLGNRKTPNLLLCRR